MCMKLKVTLPSAISAGLKGMISRGIAALEINEAGHLIVTLTDKSKADLGNVVGGDGVSCTHEWIGTVLRVTSASGTSEADLKGDPGYTPRKGIDYTDGYTPQKGVDYFDGYTPQKGIDYTDGRDGAPGAPGNDGISPSITSSVIAGGHRLTITDATHTFTIDVMDGADGDGAGDMRAAIYDPQGRMMDIFAYVDNLFKSVISQSNLQEAINTALAQAKASGEFDGADGYTPQKGIDYFDGADGYTPQKGVDYFDGKDGYTPQKGVDYFDGEDGYTPQKGTDYWTADDKAEIIAEVLAELPATSELPAAEEVSV